MRFSKRLSAVLLLMIGGSIAGWWHLKSDGAHRDGGPLVLTGSIDIRQVNLAFTIEGRIAAMLVEEGERVDAGQQLARIEPADGLGDLRVAQAGVDGQRAALSRLETPAGPAEPGAIEAARARLHAAETRLSQLSRRLADSELLAPAPGIVLTRALGPGATVLPGTPVYTLALMSPVWVRTYVAEPDLGLVALGMPAEVTTEAAPGRVFTGHVALVSPVAEIDRRPAEVSGRPARLVHRLRIVIEHVDRQLRQGAPAVVTLRPARPAS